jgi:hypothetical protein
MTAKTKTRNYKKEYANYQGKPDQRKRNDARKQSRRNMVKVHGKAKLQGKDIDHKDRNPLNKAKSNLRVSSVKANRKRNGTKKK